MRKVAETVVVVPARKNSSRVKDKNIASVGGHPLMSYTIRLAKALHGVETVYVDTDSEQYAAIARDYGAEVPFLREPDMATGKASLGAAIDRFLKRLCKEEVQEVTRCICMLPTSPFRHLAETQELVDALQRFRSVNTVMMANVQTLRSHVQISNEILALKDFVNLAGQQYFWMKQLGNFIGTYRAESAPMEIDTYNCFGYRVLSNPVELVDVDVHRDLQLVRRIVEERLYDFGMCMT